MRNRLRSWNTSVTLVRIISYNGVIGSSGNFFGDGTWYWFDSGAYAGYTGLAPDTGSGKQSLFLFDNAKARRPLRSCSRSTSRTPGNRLVGELRVHVSTRRSGSSSTADYQFDYGHAYYSPYVLSNQVPKHRLVAVGSVDVPWGITLGAKVVLETPKPLYRLRSGQLTCLRPA